MNLLSRFFSQTERNPLPEDFDELLAALAKQRSRIANAEHISKIRLELLQSGVAAGQGVTFADASGPSLVTAELSPSDARKLAKSGIGEFRSEVNTIIKKVEGRLDEVAERDVSASVAELLAIMAGTDENKAAVREAAGYFMIERLGSKAGTSVESALGHADANIRFQAAHVLRFLHSDRAVDHLILALKDPDADVRAMVTHALALQKNKKAVAALLDSAEHDLSPEVRATARAAADALQET